MQFYVTLSHKLRYIQNLLYVMFHEGRGSVQCGGFWEVVSECVEGRRKRFSGVKIGASYAREGDGD